MGSDRARISFDPSRQYRSVISQQGRVTLEADVNEASAIAAAERRWELAEMIGLSGTPDDGYRLLPATGVPGDFLVQAGTMYVGGERIVTAGGAYSDQLEWLDKAGDPLWVDCAVPSGGRETVYLLLREQEVGAVEDPALRDLALGGPDTAARSRIVQRIIRTPTTATTCADALAALEQGWAAQGLTFDAATMQLRSQATLQVSYQQPPVLGTIAQPLGTGGYLGPENQLIRVQVAGVDANGHPTLVWGYDNASFLYRVHGAVQARDTTVTLENVPVDSYHQPVKKQAVEILQAAAVLSLRDYLAATTGMVTTLAAPYAPDTQQIQLTDPITADQADSARLYVRVWQAKVPWAEGPLALDGTGIEVTLTKTGDAWHVGDYWVFAVRPGTQTAAATPVYPERILDDTQPPDGPSIWACPLAVVAWSEATPTFTDCRRRFDSLVSVTEEANGCCTVQVTPESVGGGAGLQALVTAAADGPARICLHPGTYTLPHPLVISGDAPLTIEACHGTVALQAGADIGTEFARGLIVAESATQLTLRGLTVSVPAVPFPIPTSSIANLPSNRQPLLTAYASGLNVAFGVGVLSATSVTIQACAFELPDAANTSLFSAGVIAQGSIERLEIIDCTFSATEPATTQFGDMRLGKQAAPPYQLRFGYLHVPSAARRWLPPRPRAGSLPSATRATPTGESAAQIPTDVAPSRETVTSTHPEEGPITHALSRIAHAIRPQSEAPNTAQGSPVTAAAGSSAGDAAGGPPTGAVGGEALDLITATLDDARFTGNLFDGLTVPILALGDLRTVRVTDSAVRACYGGFWLIPADADLAVTVIDHLDPTDAFTAAVACQTGVAALTDPVLWLATAIGRLLPLAPPDPLRPEPLPVIDLPSATLLQNAGGLLGRLVGPRDVAPTSSATPSADAAAAAQTAVSGAPVSAGAPTPSAPAETTTPTGQPIEPGITTLGGLTLPSPITPIFQLPGLDQPPVPPTVDAGTGATPRIAVHGNQVDAIVASSYSGTALLIACLLPVTAVSSLLCTGNRLRGRVESGPTASLNSLNDLFQCTLTGNIVSNEIVDSSATAPTTESSTPPYPITTHDPITTNYPSIVLTTSRSQSLPLVTVTGNVLVGGPPALPVRPLPAPLNVWDALNTITNYVAPTAD